jgi:thiol:disulfide interchange protein
MVLQFLNQYGLLLLPLGLLAFGAIVLIRKRSSRKWWLTWVGLAALLAVGFFSLRTPAATLTYFQPSDPDSPDPVVQVSEVHQFADPEALRSFLATSGGKPTLVDFYTDFGVG